MNFFDLIQSFVERTAREEQPATLAREFQRALEQMGYRHYACCSHVNPLHPPPGSIVLHNYPSSWASEFCERRLWQVDPVLMFAERSSSHSPGKPDISCRRYRARKEVTARSSPAC